MERSLKFESSEIDVLALRRLTDKLVQRFSLELIGTGGRISLGGFIGLYDSSRNTQILDSVGITSGTSNQMMRDSLKNNCMAVLKRRSVSSYAVADPSAEPPVSSGAIMLENSWVYGFEGFCPVSWNEAFATASAFELNLIGEARLTQIKIASRNPYIDKAVEFFCNQA